MGGFPDVNGTWDGEVLVYADRVLLKRTIRAVRQGLILVRRAGYPVLPGRLKTLRFVPAGLAADKVARTLRSRFGKIALAGHAATARKEMRHLADGLLRLGELPAADLHYLLSLI